MAAVDRPTINYLKTTSVHIESANPRQCRMQRPINPTRPAFLVAGAGSCPAWRPGTSSPRRHLPGAPRTGAPPTQSRLQKPWPLTMQSRIKNAQHDRAFCASPADPFPGFQYACRATDLTRWHSLSSFDNRQRLHWIPQRASGKSRDSPSQASPSWVNPLKRS